MDNKLKRKYLTQGELLNVMAAARTGRYAERDECFINLCFIHGLRVSEICQLRISDINLEDGVIHIRRLKNGLGTTQPLLPKEMILLEKWLNVRGSWSGGGRSELFLSQKRGPISRQQVYTLLRKYGHVAGITVPLHPHMLRHSCGYALANNGADTRLIQDYLGHRNIHHTVLYTASNSARFVGMWKKSFIFELNGQ